MECDRCDGTGLDPDRYTEQQEPGGAAGYRTEPCAECQDGCWCGHPKDRHWSDAANMTFPDGCHDCPGWDGAHAYGQELPWAADYATEQ